MPDDKTNTLTLGKAIDRAWELREKKRALEAQVKLIEADIALNDDILFARLDAEDTVASRGSKASVAITETINFNIIDFDAFSKYVAKTKYFHLFQRRVSDLAARELFETKGQVPGLLPFKKRRINLLSLSK